VRERRRGSKRAKGGGENKRDRIGKETNKKWRKGERNRKKRARAQVEWRTVTWFCNSPSHSEGVDNKSLSWRRRVVVDYLNKFEIYLPNWSRGPLHNVVVVRNMRFVSPKV